MSLLTEKLLREMYGCEGVIIRHKGMETWPIHPRGDRRKRPVAWITASDAMSLLKDGMLEQTRKGIGLSAQMRRRFRFGQTEQNIDRGEIYTPDRRTQAVRRNTRGTVVERLARKRNRNGETILTAAQIEAMQRFTRDWESAAGRPQSSDPGRPSVDVSMTPDHAEAHIITRIDAGTRLKRAQDALGPDLSALMGKVCGANEQLDAIERAEGWSRGAGLTMLRIGLDRLSGHYGTVPGVPYTRKAG